MTKLHLWLGGWIEIAQGIVCVLTLARYAPNWEMSFYAWATLKKIRSETDDME
jgi:hypothetical protein